jgi:hypothetical protein
MTGMTDVVVWHLAVVSRNLERPLAMVVQL